MAKLQFFAALALSACYHFAKNGVGLDALSATNLIVPMAVIDFRRNAARDVDAALGVVSPGIGVAAANWLISNRNIWGVGVDTLSFDPGNDNDYKTHRAGLGAGKWAVEAVANLQDVPPLGATLFVGAPKVRDATGGPVLLIALRPKSPAFAVRQLYGVWRNQPPERVDRADGSSVYVEKEFTFDGNRWRIVFTVSEDIGGTSRIFGGDFSGPYSVGDYVPLVQAFRGRFLFSEGLFTSDPVTAKPMSFHHVCRE